jgi:uncharacterized delta-60 repeat protein
MKSYYAFFLFLSFTITFGQQSGELDTSFATSGFFISDDENLDYGGSFIVLPNDQIIMVGGNDNFTAIKLLPNGTYDTTFGNNGKVIVGFEGYSAVALDVALQSDGKIVLVGNVYINGGVSYFGVIRLLSDGTLDTTFNGTGKLVFDFNETKNYAESVALQADGKIVVAGQSGQFSNADFAVARINVDGTFDSSFGTNGKLDIAVQIDDRGKCVAIQQDGKIIIGGHSYTTGSNYSWFSAVRLTPSGELDLSFSSDGKALTKVGNGNDEVVDMVLQLDGKILMVADSALSSSQNYGAVRFTTLGELDTTFSGDGKFNITMGSNTNYCEAVVVQPDGKIIIGGTFFTPAGREIGIVRLTESGILDTTFSNDGKANFAVPITGGVELADMKLQSTGQILVSGSIQNDYTMARILSGNELNQPQWNQGESSVYPNPANDFLYFSEFVNSVVVFTIEGKKVMEKTLSNQQLDVSSLSKGIYVLTLQTTDGKKTTKKIIIE